MYKKITSGYVPICEKCGYAVGVVCDTEIECYDYPLCKKCSNNWRNEKEMTVNVKEFYDLIKDAKTFDEIQEILGCGYSHVYTLLNRYGFVRDYESIKKDGESYSVYRNGDMKISYKNKSHDKLEKVKDNDVMKLCRQGYSVGEMAEKLRVCSPTVRNKLISVGFQAYTYKRYKTSIYYLGDIVVYPKTRSNSKKIQYRIQKTIENFEKWRASNGNNNKQI